MTLVAVAVCNVQAHKQSLQRKLQERQADVHAQQQELAATEKVRANIYMVPWGGR